MVKAMYGAMSKAERALQEFTRHLNKIYGEYDADNIALSSEVCCISCLWCTAEDVIAEGDTGIELPPVPYWRILVQKNSITDFCAYGKTLIDAVCGMNEILTDWYKEQDDGTL